ncbi:MAG: glycine-rich domain-containing protein [bacterium]
MAIAKDATSIGTAGNPVSSITWNHVCSGINRFLVVTFFIADNDTSKYCTATYNGVSMTLVDKGYHSGTQGTWGIFYLVNPDAGTHAVVLNLVGTATYIDGMASSYMGVAQTSPITNSNKQTTGTGSTETNTVTVANSGGWLMGIFAQNKGSGNVSASTSTYQRVIDISPQSSGIFDSNGGLKAGSNSLVGASSQSTPSWVSIVFDVSPAFSTVKVLAIGGGGGGSNGGYNGGEGGGGAGGYQYNSAYTVTPGTYSVTVGTGGAVATKGNDSKFGTITATGGGAGVPNNTGGNGGSGAGGSCPGSSGNKSGGTGSQGYNGGSSYTNSSSNWSGGGGGGAGQVGYGGGDGTYPGRGGDGVVNPITGSTIGENVSGTYYICGGGGGALDYSPGSQASGGKGGGGKGWDLIHSSNHETAGMANTGGGGGGGENGTGTGGSGAVVISWVTADFGTCSVTGTGNTITTSGSNSIATFIVSGNITFTLTGQYIQQPSAKDNTMLSDAPTTNDGSDPLIQVCGETGTPTHAHRSIIEFDISGLGKPSSSIYSAVMSLYYVSKGANYTGAQTLYADKITRDNWTELGSTWNKYDGTNNWTTGGGDYTSTNESSAFIDATVERWIEFDVTDLVKDAIDNVSGHLNLVIRRPTGLFNNDDNNFYSKDYTTDTTLQPKISIMYSPSTTYTLTASQGSIALTGIATAFYKYWEMVASLGTYVLTGIATLLHHVKTIALAYGTYTLTGIATGLSHLRTITANYGSYILTGIATLFKRYFHIITDVGHYTLTGINAILYKGHTIIANFGSYTLTGIDTLFHTLLHMIASLGTYTLTGIDAIFHRNKVLLAGIGTYTLTGIDTLFNRIIKMIMTYGTYTLTGISSTFHKLIVLLAVYGSYVLTGLSINLNKYLKMISSFGSYTLTGIDVGIHRVRVIMATYGTYALTGIATLFNKYWKLTAILGTYALNGISTTLHKVFKALTAIYGSYVLTGISITFVKSLSLIATTGKYVLKGFKVKLIAPFHTYWKQKVVSSATWKKLTQPSTPTDWHKVDRGN